ncbi:MAG: hypothetical protein ACI8RD_004557 [Bacillariaceae sp.]|jgi:hypothetical protein
MVKKKILCKVLVLVYVVLVPLDHQQLNNQTKLQEGYDTQN